MEHREVGIDAFFSIICGLKYIDCFLESKDHYLKDNKSLF